MSSVQLNPISEGKAVAYLQGRLDVAISGEIEENLLAAIERDSLKWVVLNMEEVEYMSSSGFRVAIALLRRLKEAGGTLKICNLQPAVKRIFDVIELTSLFDIYDSEKEAVEALG